MRAAVIGILTVDKRVVRFTVSINMRKGEFQTIGAVVDRLI